MFDFLSKLRGPTPDFHSIQMDAHGWQPQGQHDAQRAPLWKTPEGDAIGLDINRKRPKLPQSMDLYGYRNLFVRSMQSGRGVPVELGSLRVAECPAIQFIYKIPQPQGGTAYCGTLTLPFRRFSFIYQVHCPGHEHGEVRDSILRERGISAPAPKPQKWPEPGSVPHPDSAQFDEEFPMSPVARLRRILKRIAQSASIEERIAQLPTCSLPE